jgi:uncharacterized protein with HEPN domain
MRTDHDRLLDIEEAIGKIERYASRGKVEFMDNELIQTWVLFQLQIIGEATRSLSAEIRAENKQVSWQDIIDFRAILWFTHNPYFRVNLDLVWAIVEREIPTLKAQITKILGESPRQ